MKKKILPTLKYLFFLGLGIFLIWWQVSKMTPEEKEAFVFSIRHTQFLYLIPIFIMAMLSHLSRAIRWKIMIEPMGYKISTANAFYATLCGYFANTFVPRAGEILKCTLVTKYDKVPFPKLVGTIITERIFDFICYLLVILITILVQLKTVSSFFTEKFSHFFSTDSKSSFFVKILLAAFVIAMIIFGIKWIFRRFQSHRYIMKIKSVGVGLKEGFSSILHLKKKSAFIGHTIFIWLMYLTQIWVGFSALSETLHLGIGAALSVLSLSTLAMIIAPGGLGAFPIAVQQVLLIYGLDNISFGWLMWGVTTGIIIIAGFISFGLIVFTNKNKHEKNGYPIEQDADSQGTGS